MRYLTCACLFLHKRVSPLVSPVHITRAPTTKLPTSNSEINDVNSDAKHVSKVQRFMLPLKIQPISVHKEKKSIVRPALFLKKNQSWFLPMIPLPSGCRGASVISPIAC